jgi:hypothetical protein
MEAYRPPRMISSDRAAEALAAAGAPHDRVELSALLFICLHVLEGAQASREPKPWSILKHIGRTNENDL